MKKHNSVLIFLFVVGLLFLVLGLLANIAFLMWVAAIIWAITSICSFITSTKE